VIRFFFFFCVVCLFVCWYKLPSVGCIIDLHYDSFTHPMKSVTHSPLVLINMILMTIGNRDGGSKKSPTLIYSVYASFGII
jgi:hypothetical protein